MTISAALPTFVQLPGNGVALVFAAPMKCFQSTDVKVGFVVGGAYSQQFSGFSIDNIDNNGGFTVTFAVAPPLGTTVDIRTNTPQVQPTDFANLGSYLPENSTECFDRLTREIQDLTRLTFQFGVHGPDTESTPWPALGSAALRANNSLIFDTNGLPTIGALTTVPLTAALVGQFFYPTLAGEVGVLNNIYPYGCPRRHGAAGDGVTNDTTAVQNAINSGFQYFGWLGDSYGVTTVIWPASGFTGGNFNGTELVGIATSPTICISQVKCNFATIIGYSVNGGSAGGVTPNPNYQCATWWFNGIVSGSPVGASQFNTFYGMQHISCVRALVYGGLPGSSSSTIVHSENKIYGFQTVGVSNPIYMNSGTGFLHCYGATFFRDASTWTVPNLPATARAFEVTAGALFINGGEIIASNSLVGFASDGPATISGAFLELSAPMHITASMRMVNCFAQVNNQGVSMFAIDAAATGVLAIASSVLQRPAGVGLTDRQPLVDGTLNSTFEVDFNDTESFEWGFQMAGANCKLIQGCVAKYSNHRFSQTAGAPVYVLNNPKVSIIPDMTLDHMGYTTNGWTLTVAFGGGTSLANTSAAGPSGYLPSQLTLVAPGQATALSGDPTSLTTIKATMNRVFPGERFWLSSQVQMASGTSVQLQASFFNTAGSLVASVLAADTTSIGTGSWVSAEGGILVPASAAYMAVGVLGNACTVLFTNVKLQLA